MKNRELREWCGATVADCIAYLAIGAVVAASIVESGSVRIALVVAAPLLALAACHLGMRRDPALSAFTQNAKRMGYPLLLLLVVSALVIRFVL